MPWNKNKIIIFELIPSYPNDFQWITNRSPSFQINSDQLSLKSYIQANGFLYNIMKTQFSFRNNHSPKKHIASPSVSSPLKQRAGTQFPRQASCSTHVIILSFIESLLLKLIVIHNSLESIHFKSGSTSTTCNSSHVGSFETEEPFCFLLFCFVSTIISIHYLQFLLTLTTSATFLIDARPVLLSL